MFSFFDIEYLLSPRKSGYGFHSFFVAIKTRFDIIVMLKPPKEYRTFGDVSLEMTSMATTI